MCLKKKEVSLFFLQAISYEIFIKLHASMEKYSDALWVRIAQNVKKPPLSLNVIDFEFSGFNVSVGVCLSNTECIDKNGKVSRFYQY